MEKKIKLINQIKNLFPKSKENYKLFFNTYAKNIGYYLIHYYLKKKFVNFQGIKIIFKDFLSTAKNNYLNNSSNKNINFFYDKIIVSWAFKKDFSKKGIFYDKLLNTKSNEIKNSLWFLIYMDLKLPSKIGHNIVLINQDKKINLVFLFLFFLKNIFKKFYSVVYNLQLFSSFSSFAEVIKKYFKFYLNKNVKLLFMPYEAQPFQNLLFKTSKNYSKKIKTVGYIHSPPEALPVQSIKKSGSPDKLILNGNDQIYCYHKYLGWKKNQLLNFKSLRFNTEQIKKKDNLNKIFLSYSIKNSHKILNSLKYLYYQKIIDIKKFKIQPHPLTKKNKEILQIVNKIKKIKTKKNYTFKMYDNQKIAIFIGATGAPSEFLERGINSIHICDDPIIEIYSEKLYPSIKVKKITNNIYFYKLRKKDNFLRLGLKKDNLNSYLKKIF